jgi:hypothetical protein
MVFSENTVRNGKTVSSGRQSLTAVAALLKAEKQHG